MSDTIMRTSAISGLVLVLLGTGLGLVPKANVFVVILIVTIGMLIAGLSWLISHFSCKQEG